MCLQKDQHTCVHPHALDVEWVTQQGVPHTTTHTHTHMQLAGTPSSCCGVEGGMPASCMCVRVCVPYTLHPVRVDAHICVLIFLKANDCPSPSIILPLSPPYHVEERESKAEGSRAAMQSGAEQAGGQAAR